MGHTMSSGEEIRVGIEIAASPKRVFEALTDPREVTRWWGTGSYRCTAWEADLRPGGRWRCEHSGEGPVFIVSGRYLEVEPPRRLRFTREPETIYENLGSTEVLIELIPSGTGTRLSLAHRGFGEHRQARDEHHQGWTASAQAAKDYLESAGTDLRPSGGLL